MSWLSKMSLRNRSIVGLAILAVLLGGAYAITSLKQELIPDLTFPYLTVLTVDQGASPADVERSVTTPIEQALKRIRRIPRASPPCSTAAGRTTDSPAAWA